MRCAEVRELVQVYMDNELNARTTLDLQLHLESCSACARVFEECMAQDRMLKESARAEAVAVEDLRQRILAAIRAESQKPRISFRRASFWKRAAVFAVITVVGFFILIQQGLLPGAGGNVYAAVAGDHADHCTPEAVKGGISNADELVRLASGYGKLSGAPDLAAFGYRDPRGMICKLDGTEYLHLVYFDNKQRSVSLFLRRDGISSLGKDVSVLQQDGYNVAAVTRSGVDLLVVSSPDENRGAEMARSVVERV